MDLNRVMLIGNLTRDPEVRTTPNGRSVASVGLATNRFWTDQSGVKQKDAEFHNIVFWAKLADIAGQYLRKGSKVFVEGRLKTREWTGQDGNKRVRTEIIAESMIMLGTRPEGGVRPLATGAPMAAGEADLSPEAPAEEVIKVEDIPF